MGTNQNELRIDADGLYCIGLVRRGGGDEKATVCLNGEVLIALAPDPEDRRRATTFLGLEGDSLGYSGPDAVRLFLEPLEGRRLERSPEPTPEIAIAPEPVPPAQDEQTAAPAAQEF